ncbi:MAG TPA: lantibiotic dehydratase [Candidatus Dormibacteraeota bacterium]|nr:lantibiotic dehydratase [Candidatus Dormibacteraeota bacterium]
MSTPRDGAPLPDHLVRVGRDWAAWRWFCLRGAGFPIEHLADLASPACARAADRLVQAEAAGDAAEREFSDEFQAAVARFTSSLRERAADPALQEAVVWQNRHAWSTGISVLLASTRGPEQRSSKHRAKEALLTSYLQRYCAKNDSIGFFGPVGWGRIEDGAPPLACRPGPGLVASRTVYFEGWAIDALAASLGEDRALRPWLAPRMLPGLYLDGCTLHGADGSTRTLLADESAVLRACRGDRMACELARDVLDDASTSLAAVSEVYDTLSRLEEMRLIAWALEVPVDGLFPERTLRAQIDRIGDETLRARCERALTALEEGRRTIVLADRVDRLEPAMVALEQTFEDLTGAASTRRHGETYAGRTVVYEDCRRDVDLTLGPGLTAALEGPLELLLRSARWFTAEAAAIYRQACCRVYEDLAAETGQRVLPFPAWWSRARHLIFDLRSPHLSQARERLQDRWAAILGDTETQPRRTYGVAELAPLVDAAFAAGAPGWRAACHHSIDLLIGGRDVQSIQRGDCQYVLGELHVGGNTLQTACLMSQHPAPDQMLRAMCDDLPEALVHPVASRRGISPRLSSSLVRPDDLRLVLARDTCGVPPERSLPFGSLTVEREGPSLVVHTRDGRLHLEIVELLGELIAWWTLQHFQILRPARHTSRLSFGPLVVARERWAFQSGELSFASLRPEARRFLEVRRWVLANDLPRFVFAHVPGERKPFFVDLESLPSIDVFCRTVRRHDRDGTSRVTVTEMLPDPDDAWLPDAEGRRYTCELRIVLVDRSRGRVTEPSPPACP